jgi:hypothetical protein
LNIRAPFEFPYLANQFCLVSFVMFTEIFQLVDFCVRVRTMGVSVRVWFDALKRDSHVESVRLDRYALDSVFHNLAVSFLKEFFFFFYLTLLLILCLRISAVLYN